MKVKVCGVTRYEDARLALELGAWAIGLNFHRPSPRWIDPRDAAEIVRRLPAGSLAVGVFVDCPLEDLHRIAAQVGLGGVQLHGGESPAFARAVRSPLVIKAFGVGPGFDPRSVEAYPGCAVLLDASVQGLAGGTGRTCDWAAARRVQEIRPVILAGGLTPLNVREALAAVAPEGIDLAGGVESSPGRKDPGKLRRLFEELALRGAGSSRSWKEGREPDGRR